MTPRWCRKCGTIAIIVFLILLPVLLFAQERGYLRKRIASFEEPAGYPVEIYYAGRLDANTLWVTILTTPDNPDIVGGPAVVYKSSTATFFVVSMGGATFQITPKAQNTVEVVRIR